MSGKSLKLLNSASLAELNWLNPHPRGEYVIPEPDVYRLIVKSTKPEAERFEKWVFEEVLPSIRKTGKYSLINATENYSAVDLRALSVAARAASESALATAKANRILADTALALANQYENHSSSETVISQAKSQSPTKSQQALLPPRELAFIHAWSECLGSQTVTASDLYRAITAHQCQVLNDASGALLGDVAQWTSKKLSYALRCWSELALDDFVVVNMGKTSRGILWRLERKG